MGCHRRLGYARLLNRSGFGFVTVFVIHVLQSLSSLQLQEPKWLSFRFHSIQPLSHSRNKSPFVRTPSLSRGTCFPLCFLPFQSFRCTSFLQPHQQPTLAVGFTPHISTPQAPFNQPQVSLPNPTANKNMRQTLVHTA